MSLWFKGGRESEHVREWWRPTVDTKFALMSMRSRGGPALVPGTA